MFVTAHCLHFVHFLTPQIRFVVCHCDISCFSSLGITCCFRHRSWAIGLQKITAKATRALSDISLFKSIKFTQRPNFRGNIYLFWEIKKEIWVNKSSDNDVRLRLLCRKHLLDNFQMLSLHTRTVHLLNSLRSNGNYAEGGGASYRTIRVQLAICKCKRSGEHSKFPH